jgi:nucleoside-diphosphate-sugar epimerase
MGKVLIICAGGVATVAAHKVAQNPEVFNEIMIASRTKAKCDRLAQAVEAATGYKGIKTAHVDADNVPELVALLSKYKPDIVVNLAAQAGVRYSIDHPDVYIESNLIRFYNILEACRHSYDNGSKGVEHLVYASSSSVYGGNKKVPFSTDDKVDNQVSLYAATKKSNELLAHA